jgi:hypothetical protein
MSLKRSEIMMKHTQTYYLWKDKNGTFFITDYKETDKKGRVNIDGYGYLEVELELSSKVKTDLLTHVQALTYKR